MAALINFGLGLLARPCLASTQQRRGGGVRIEGEGGGEEKGRGGAGGRGENDKGEKEEKGEVEIWEGYRMATVMLLLLLYWHCGPGEGVPYRVTVN